MIKMKATHFAFFTDPFATANMCEQAVDQWWQDEVQK